MQERQKLLDEFDENLKAVKLSAFNIGNYCRTKEVEEVEEILLRCDIEISGDKLEDIIIEYHRLNKGIQGIIEHKKIIIKYVIKMKKSKKDVLNGIDLDKILQSMIVNVNKLISCQNRLIDRIKDINIDIFCRDNAITEGFRKPLCVLTNPCVEKRYEMNLLKQNPSDNGMEMIFDNNDVLKKWSRKKKYNVIFDSRMYGDGSNNGLRNEVINKSSLYFIVFDDNDNIFGGYVNSIIYTDNVPIRDDSSFVFSFNTERSEIKHLLSQYDVEIKGDDLREVLAKYKSNLRELNVIVKQKLEYINDIEKNIKTITEITNHSQFITTLNCLKNNVNDLIICQNKIIDRINFIKRRQFKKDNKILESWKKSFCEIVNDRFREKPLTLAKTNNGNDDMKKIFDNNDELDIHFDGTDALCEKWGDVKNDAFKKEPKEVVQLLNEYDVISKLKNDDEKINYYEEKYTELNQIINRKYDQITFIRNSSLDIQMHTNSKKIELLIYQKQESLNKLIDFIRLIVVQMS
ncbi:hypothetical protein QTN25_004683 [Entamoeba marina]